MTSHNSYLALREANITRNEQRLRELGLIEPERKKSTEKNKKRTTPSAPALAPPRELRRSKRVKDVVETQIDNQVTEEIAGLTTTTRCGTSNLYLQRCEAKMDRWRPLGPTNSQTYAVTAEDGRRVPARISTSPSHAPHKNSARGICLDVEQLVRTLLGRRLETTGKAFVMEESARAASLSCQDRPISFNKYSGVQEWANALFLWINLGAPNNDVVNEFLANGTQTTWFGGSRMHDGSTVIQKLKHIGSRATEDNRGSVVLWCRVFEDGSFGPYVCLGRLALVSYDPTAQPLAFVWRLLDVDLLHTASERLIRSTFDDITTKFASMHST